MLGVQIDHDMRLKVLESSQAFVKTSIGRIVMTTVLWFLAALLAFLFGSKVGPMQ